MLVVNALAHLHCHWHPTIGSINSRTDNRAEEIALPGQCTATALARHLRDGASEVHVNVISPILIDDDAHGLGHDMRINPIQLH